MTGNILSPDKEERVYILKDGRIIYIYTKGAMNATVKGVIRQVLAARKIHVWTRRRIVCTKARKPSE